MDHGVSFGGEVSYEYLILGAGPAGLQMGHHLSRAGYSYLILEAGDSPGTFFKTFPRHRTLASRNKVHSGSQDPEIRLRFDECSLLDEDGDGAFRFGGFSRRYFPHADEMVRYLTGYAEHHELNLRCNTRVLRVEKSPASASIPRSSLISQPSKPMRPRIISLMTVGDRLAGRSRSHAV